MSPIAKSEEMILILRNRRF